MTENLNSLYNKVLVFILFFIWGFIWNIFNVLATSLKENFLLSNTLLSLGTSISFLAFFIMPYPSQLIIKRMGVRKSICVGSIIAGMGMITLSISSLIQKYFPFLISFFILFCGVTILQTVCNPYVGSLGNIKKRESRINFAQGIGAVGAALTSPIAGWFILGLYEDRVFTGIMIFSASISLIFFLVAYLIYSSNIENFSDTVNNSCSSKQEQTINNLFKYHQFKYGLIIMFFYMGAEAILYQLMTPYFKEIGNIENKEAVFYSAFIFYGLVVGRLFGAWIMSKVRSYLLLGFFSFSATLLMFLSLVISGKLGIYIAISVGFFVSINFATIFALATEGLGKLTYNASSYLIMAISGGFVLPLIYGLLADTISLKASLFIPILSFLLCAFYGFYFNHLKN